MNKHHPDNERVKHQYLFFLKEAKGRSVDSVDAAAAALARYEEYTRYRDFKTFHHKQATSFKKHLANQISQTTGEKLSKATLNSTLAQLTRFFEWLSDKPGYKSRIRYSDAAFFNLSDKDTRIATARREPRVPTLEQIKHVLATIPAGTDIERRDRALIAFTLLTGARNSAIASMKLKHVDLDAGRVRQDAREVRTKFSKTFTTYFLPVGDEVRSIVVQWATWLRESQLWGNDDPLFPATRIVVGADRRFEVAGLERAHWRSAGPIRAIFRAAFTRAGLPYFNPHSFRHTLVQFGEARCRTPEDFKAWSQNLGHDGVLTTFCSYGAISSQRQGEIMRELAAPRVAVSPDVSALAKALAEEMRGAGCRDPVRAMDKTYVKRISSSQRLQIKASSLQPRRQLKENAQVITRLEQVLAEIDDVSSKLILLVSSNRSSQTQMLRELSRKLDIEPLNVGRELGRRLAATANNKRGFSAGELLREIADNERTEDPLLLDNLEVLFEPSLQINPLDLVKRLAHSKRVVAVWPGELRGDRLLYADMSHPEHRDYSRDGVVVLEI